MASERLALTASGQVRYTLKTPYRDGTTHIVLEPLDLMARLAALVPKPRMHLTRYHGRKNLRNTWQQIEGRTQRRSGQSVPSSTTRAMAHQVSLVRKRRHVIFYGVSACAGCFCDVADRDVPAIAAG